MDCGKYLPFKVPGQCGTQSLLYVQMVFFTPYSGLTSQRIFLVGNNSIFIHFAYYIFPSIMYFMVSGNSWYYVFPGIYIVYFEITIDLD